MFERSADVTPGMVTGLDLACRTCCPTHTFPLPVLKVHCPAFMVPQFLTKADKHADERIKLSKAIDNKIWESIGIGRKASVLLAKVTIPMLSGWIHRA